jgi:hypothetical protein
LSCLYLLYLYCRIFGNVSVVPSLSLPSILQVRLTQYESQI